MALDDFDHYNPQHKPLFGSSFDPHRSMYHGVDPSERIPEFSYLGPLDPEEVDQSCRSLSSVVQLLRRYGPFMDDYESLRAMKAQDNFMQDGIDYLLDEKNEETPELFALFSKVFFELFNVTSLESREISPKYSWQDPSQAREAFDIYQSICWKHFRKDRKPEYAQQQAPLKHAKSESPEQEEYGQAAGSKE